MNSNHAERGTNKISRQVDRVMEEDKQAGEEEKRMCRATSIFSMERRWEGTHRWRRCGWRQSSNARSLSPSTAPRSHSALPSSTCSCLWNIHEAKHIQIIIEWPHVNSWSRMTTRILWPIYSTTITNLYTTRPTLGSTTRGHRHTIRPVRNVPMNDRRALFMPAVTGYCCAVREAVNQGCSRAACNTMPDTIRSIKHPIRVL